MASMQDEFWRTIDRLRKQGYIDVTNPIHPVRTNDHVHRYPVDPSLTPEQAWQEICTNGQRITFTNRVVDSDDLGHPAYLDQEDTWATRQCDGTECVRIGKPLTN